MHKYIKILVALVIVCSVCLAGFLSYKYVNKIVEYEIAADSAAKNEPTAGRTFETVPEKIPIFAEYHIFLKNNDIHVYSNKNELLYLKKLEEPEKLSAKDRQELEQSGINIRSRSELLELLNYFNS